MSSTTAVSFVPTPAAPPATTGRPLPPALTRACLAAKTAADNKGQDVVVLDLRPLTPLFDFFVMSTGASRRQVHTIVEETDAALRSVGDSRAGVEGYDTSKWVVQDYGDVLVHVFDGDTRSYYSLEELWADAPKIDWQEELADLADGDDAVGDHPKNPTIVPIAAHPSPSGGFRRSAPVVFPA